MEGYEKTIGLKTIWLTLIRRFEYILFVFIPIALTTLIVTQVVLTKTYQSSVTVSLNTTFTTPNFEVFKTYGTSQEVLDSTVEKLQAEKGIGISASDISSGLSFKIKFKIIPRNILNAVDVIVITGLETSPKINDNPPIPATKIIDATKIFFVFVKSIFSAINILTPDEAINP